MQRGASHNRYVRKFVCFWLSGLMTITTIVVAATGTAMGETVKLESGFSSAPSVYLAQNIGRQYRTDKNTPSHVNPWSLPQPLAGPSEFQSAPEYFNPGASSGSVPQRRQGNVQRFVTPEILESLKKQQQQYQSMPDKQRYYRYAPQRNATRSAPGWPAPGLLGPETQGPGMLYQGFPESGWPVPGYPGTGSYGYPSYGSGTADPLYDAPTISPWGDDTDILYRGESFPQTPNEAMGGLPPMPMSSYGMSDEENNGAGGVIESEKNNVFNPFTFLPNRSLGEPYGNGF